MTEKWVTVQMPLEDWLQIVSDMQDMYGMPAQDIEILQNYQIKSISINRD